MATSLVLSPSSSAIVLLLLLLQALCASTTAAMTHAERLAMKERVREMFDHAYDSYIEHAFPHDELKPISGSYTDSLCELGNAAKNEQYHGVAMTLIDSLDTLVVMGRHEDFREAVQYITAHVSFDIDVRVNVFETNIRLLGGLLSAHMLASDTRMGVMPEVGPGCCLDRHSYYS